MKGGSNVNNSQTDTDRVECISEGHLQFMREFIRKEEEICKAALDRFLAARMSQRDRTWQTSSKKAVGFSLIALASEPFHVKLKCRWTNFSPIPPNPWSLKAQT
jgi:hypothetical protein